MDTGHDEGIPLSPTGVSTEHRNTTASRNYSWTPEIAALLCSEAALIALIILLSKEDQKPLNNWKAPFSLNTVAAILSVAFRTPLAFAVGSCLGQGKWSWFSKRSGPVAVFTAIDEGSRGPLGSLQLLWRLKARQVLSEAKCSHWVSFGALATVALVGVDPFLQAIINYEGQLALGDSTDVAIYGRASRLDIGSMVPNDTQEFVYTMRDDTNVTVYNGYAPWRCYQTKPNIAMSASSIVGFVNSSTTNSAKPPLITCQTGNCTWNAYSTLAFCSSCSDVSVHLKKQKTNATARFCGGGFSFTLHNGTNYTIPYGSSEIYYLRQNGIEEGGTRNLDCGYSSTVVGTTTVDPRDTYSFQTWDTLIAAFVMLHPTDRYFRGEIPWENDAMSATECGLRLCTKILQPSVTNGEIHETLLSDDFERVPGSFINGEPSSPSNASKWITNKLGMMLASRVSIPGSTGNSTCAILSRSELQLHIPDHVLAPNEIQRNFIITQASITTIIDELVSDASQRIFDALNESTSLPTSFENAARFMSYQIRELDGTRVPGIAQKWTIYIHIRWQFMIFPIVTSVLGSVFSVVVMLGSGKGKTRIMKANMLESMLHGLDEETSTQLRNTNVKEKMEKHVYVRLRDGPEGLLLRPPGGNPCRSS
ncbi:N4-(beta-N-acetylglucosaminyl)-L-asparaginase [Apiospora arundinis]